MTIRKFNEFKINEEFTSPSVKGELGNLIDSFNKPFKELSKDFRSMFKEDTLRSIKDIIRGVVDQSFKNAENEVENISDNIFINDIMNKIADSLVSLSSGIEKDIDSVIDKSKISGVKAVSKDILLGNKEFGWPGIIGLIDPNKGQTGININYKYSKFQFDKEMSEIDKKKSTDITKLKQQAAKKFLNEFRSNLDSQIDKSMNDNNIKKIYDKSFRKTTDSEYKSGDEVIYLLKGKNRDEYDPSKEVETQLNVVGKGTIKKIEDDKITIVYGTEGDVTIKTMSEIIGKSKGTNAKKAAEVLGSIKDNDDKMAQVAKFAQFLKDDGSKSKIDDIEKIIGGQ